MKVTGEPFSFYHNRKGAEEVRYQKYPNFQAKGLLLDRTLESFIQKGTDGAIPIFRKIPYRAHFNKNNYFLIIQEESFR